VPEEFIHRPKGINAKSEAKDPMVASLKSKIIRYVLVALIIGFFAIPLAAVCLFDCKFYPAQRIASILLFFCR